jgi:hypothetical protein
MAQKVFVEILDDIDGTPATHTIPFRACLIWRVSCSR